MGYGILAVNFTIRQKSDDATVAQRDMSAVFLSYGTRLSFFEDSNLCYAFMVSYVYFDMGGTGNCPE